MCNAFKIADIINLLLFCIFSFSSLNILPNAPLLILLLTGGRYWVVGGGEVTRAKITHRVLLMAIVSPADS